MRKRESAVEPRLKWQPRPPVGPEQAGPGMKVPYRTEFRVRCITGQTQPAIKRNRYTALRGCPTTTNAADNRPLPRSLAVCVKRPPRLPSCAEVVLTDTDKLRRNGAERGERYRQRAMRKGETPLFSSRPSTETGIK